jgi:hypothetical protein
MSGMGVFFHAYSCGIKLSVDIIKKNAKEE